MTNESKITLILNDKEREVQNEIIGYCSKDIDTSSQTLQDYNENILTKTGVRLQSFLHFRVKFVISPVFLYYHFYS